MSTVTVTVTLDDGDKKKVRRIVAARPSKFTIPYWREKIFHATTVRDGEKYVSPNWMAAFSHKGHRESLSLGDRTHEAAAAYARDAFVYLKANGWEIWRAAYKAGPTRWILIKRPAAARLTNGNGEQKARER